MAGIRVNLGAFTAPFFSNHANTTYVASVQADFSSLSNDPLKTFTGTKNVAMENPPGSGMYGVPTPVTFVNGKAYIPVEREFSDMLSFPVSINFKIQTRTYYLQLDVAGEFDHRFLPLLTGPAVTAQTTQLVLASALNPEQIANCPYTAVFQIRYQLQGEDYILESSIEDITLVAQGGELVFAVNDIEGLKDIIEASDADAVAIKGYLVSSCRPKAPQLAVVAFALG